MDSNADYAAFLPALRKMASMSQLPYNRSKRSPNPLLPYRSSRVSKPASTQVSPAHGTHRRRNGPASTYPMRPATFHAADGFSGNFAVAAMPPHENMMPTNSRPSTWHSNAAASVPYYPQNSIVSQPGYYQQTWNAARNNGQLGSVASQWPNTQMSQSSQTWFDASLTEADGNQLPIDNLNISQMGSGASASQVFGYNGTLHNSSDFLYDDEGHHAGDGAGDQDDDDEELVGMGLHDQSTNYGQTSLLLGAGLDEHEKPSSGAGLSLCSDFPPPEQVPDAIPDEGNDTPITNDFNQWSSPVEQLAITPHDYPQQLQQPQQYEQYQGWTQQPQMYDMSGQSFLFDDPYEQQQHQWFSTPQKPLPTNGMGYNAWGWTGPQAGYWS